jgi:methyl-accepting chemotaxis protein
MKISTKLALHTAVLAIVNVAIAAAGFSGIQKIRQSVRDLTGRSSQYQMWTLELQEALQGFSAAITKASVARTAADLEALKADAAKAVAEVRFAEDALNLLSPPAARFRISAEISARAQDLFPALEASISAQEAALEAGSQTAIRMGQCSRQLSELDAKIRALQPNAANCLLGDSELLRLEASMESRAQQLLAARNPAEAGAAAQGIREVFGKIDLAMASLESMLKKIEPNEGLPKEALRILASVYASTYALRQFLLSDTGAYSKINGSLAMSAKAVEVTRQAGEAVERYAGQSRARVSNAHGDQDKAARSVNEALGGTGRGLLVLGVCATLIGLACSTALSRGVLRPLREFGALSAKFGDGDLTVRMNEDRKDEFGGLARHLNRAALKIHSMLGELSEAAGKLMQAAMDFSETSGGVFEEASGMSGQMQQTAASAMETNERIKDTHAMVAAANASMLELSAAIQMMSEQSESAKHIVKTIDEIAFKTNILSLNAAIEAARAGAAGAGFSVVAQEVRSLAAQSASAARETTERIGEITARTRKGKQAAKATLEAFEKVAGLTAQVDSFVAGITASSKEQEGRIKRIHARTSKMGRIAQENAAAAKSVSRSVKSFRAKG